MNAILARQIRKHLAGADVGAPPLRDFLAAVDGAFVELQQERDRMEHILEVASEELTEANEKLRRESELRLQNLDHTHRQTLELQEGMTLCYREVDGAFVHTLCRGRLAERLGWSPSRVEGGGLVGLYPEFEYSRVVESYARAWAGSPTSLEVQIGEIVFIALFRPRREGAAVAEVIISGVEITALKEYERSLMRAKDRAEQADRAKSEFLAVMSHEIRTPLNAILGFSDLLSDTPLDTQQAQWLQTVASSAESLRRLIEDILDYSRMEAGMLQLNPKPLDLGALLRDVRAHFAPAAAMKNLSLTAMRDPSVPDWVSLDRERLQQLLGILVGNAIKFTERGSVEIAVTSPEPSVNNLGQRLLQVEVRDSGIGIPTEKRCRIFKPFSQADSSTTRAYGGTGLGLALARRLVERMGGAIGYFAREPQGTVFHFSVVWEPVGRTDPAQASRPEGRSIARRLRVLVIDDRPQDRDFLGKVLELLPCDADFAESGAAALALSHARTYDLVFMDLQMPGMDGLETARRIRSLGTESSRARIVALTASTLANDHSACFEAGMNAVFSKPLRLDDLREEVSLAMANLVAGAPEPSQQPRLAETVEPSS